MHFHVNYSKLIHIVWQGPDSPWSAWRKRHDMKQEWCSCIIREHCGQHGSQNRNHQAFDRLTHS